MNEQEERALVARWAAQVAWHQEAAKRCSFPEAALAHEGLAAGLEEAVVDLVALLDGREVAHAFRERLTGGPGRSVEAVRPSGRVRHLSEKATDLREAS